MRLRLTPMAAAVFLISSPAVSQDSDGCYAPTQDCVTITSEWKNNDFYARFKNSCQGRIYMRFCNEQEGGREDCGASGVDQGERKTWRTGDKATGRTSARWLGSQNGSKDWVCSSKVSGWKDDMF